MAIRKVTGVPRSGKTYFAVDHLLKNYFFFNKELNEYQKKDEFKELVIITDIEDLKLDHINLDQAAKSQGISLAAFFKYPFQEELHKKYNKIIYIIDECQRIFHRKFYDLEVFLYFEKHGHFGDDIYLLTQDQSKLSYDIGIMAETELRAVPRTLSIGGELKYNLLVNGEIIDKKVIRPRKEVYKLYKSQYAFETEKVKRPWIKYILVPLIILPILLFVLKRRLMPDEAQANMKEVKTQIIAEVRKPEFKWIALPGFIEYGDKVVLYIDPLDGQMKQINKSSWKFEVRYPRTLYALVDLQTAEKIAQAAAGAEAAGRAGRSAED